MSTVKVVVAGCRYYDDYSEAKEYIDLCLADIKNENDIIIVSGGAKGADTLGERYAKENDFKIEKYPANWEKYGKSAGPMRNKKMAQSSDMVICFWDGESRGTRSMIEYANEYKRKLFVKTII